MTVPTNPTTGIVESSESAEFKIGLPNASRADKSQRERNGVVSYDNNNGSTTVPVLLNDGSVQLNTVIDSKTAPMSYSYPITVPNHRSSLAGYIAHACN